MPPAINRETVSGEALLLLRNLRQHARTGRSNKLAEVKARLEPSVSLEFEHYFFFLRKHHYLEMDPRDAQLRLTDQGERIVAGAGLQRFASEVGAFFAEHLVPEDVTDEAQPIELARLGPAIQVADEDVLVEAEEVEPLDDDDPALRVAVVAAAATNPEAPPAYEFGEGVVAISEAPVLVAPEGGADAAASRYPRLEPIGHGPLATVYRARHGALGIDVCVKELKDLFGAFTFLERSAVLARLRRTLNAQAALDHPGVVRILDHALEAPRPFFVTELCGGSLRAKLDRAPGRPVPVPQALRLFLQVVHALRAAHQRGLMHHDLKPENVLLDGNGNAKIADFGMARLIDVEPARGLPPVFVGTGGMPYLAPELLHRATDAGPAADVYAAGILLHELLTGQLPGRRSPMPSELNPDVPPRLDALFDRMTQDRREHRYADCDAVLADFHAAYPAGEFLSRGDLISWSS